MRTCTLECVAICCLQDRLKGCCLLPLVGSPSSQRLAHPQLQWKRLWSPEMSWMRGLPLVAGPQQSWACQLQDSIEAPTAWLLSFSHQLQVLRRLYLRL